MKKSVLSIIVLLAISSCKMADLRTEYMSLENPADDDQKARRLLEASVESMGYNAIADLESYEATALIDWRFPWSAMPINSLPGAKCNEIRFRFRPNSFDGHVEYLEGRKSGDIHGLQSWETYKMKAQTPIADKDKRRGWALAAYHYMLEGPYRLLNADVIKYAGETTFEGQNYDLVFASWKESAPHKEHDQWLLYINKETKFVDLANLTIRDFFMPFPPKLAEGTVRYIEREKTTSGIHFPTNLVIQLLDPKKEKKHVYRITLSDYKFNSFDVNSLSPLKGLPKYGDEKPAETK